MTTFDVPELWVPPAVVDGNSIRHLAVPAHQATVEAVNSGERLVAVHGRWDLMRGSQDGKADLHLRVEQDGRAAWRGTDPELPHPAEVLESLDGRFRYLEMNEDGSRPGLRTPQLGAVHAVAGYWATAPTLPATVVMPTATGKTDTMNAIFVARQLHRLLVIVPTDALRSQLARKLETYGVLPQVGVLGEPVLRPVVGTVEHAFSSRSNAVAFAERCNIIVATVSALTASAETVRQALLDECSHLFIDEAHHVAAAQWEQVRDYFHGRHVVQFTATPFRADGKHLGGRLVFAFPLREAQRQGYSSRIDYIPITNYLDPDLEIATTAVTRLRQDLAAGYDRLLMARVRTDPTRESMQPMAARLGGPSTLAGSDAVGPELLG